MASNRVTINFRWIWITMQNSLMEWPSAISYSGTLYCRLRNPPRPWWPRHVLRTPPEKWTISGTAKRWRRLHRYVATGLTHDLYDWYAVYIVYVMCLIQPTIIENTPIIKSLNYTNACWYVLSNVKLHVNSCFEYHKYTRIIHNRPSVKKRNFKAYHLFYLVIGVIESSRSQPRLLPGPCMGTVKQPCTSTCTGIRHGKLLGPQCLHNIRDMRAHLSSSAVTKIGEIGVRLGF